MYVCICRQVTCGQIRAAASEGVDNVRALKEQLGVASQCGKCAGCARGVLEEIHGCKASRGNAQLS
ncbi:(2Fe-2S)-binding protein [Pseudomonadota bacterium]